MAEITVTFGGSSAGRYIFNKGEMTIGRTRDCDIVIENLSVSRKHARLSCEDDQFFVTDLSSGNGTFVNGKEITSKTRLRENDVIVIGKHKLLFTNPLADRAIASDVFGAERTKLVDRPHVAYLEAIEGKFKGMKFRIDKPKVSIGRGTDCDIRIDDRQLGKQQCVIHRQGDDFLLRNENRWRPTKINRVPVTEAPLNDSNHVFMGGIHMVFYISDEEIVESS